MFTTLLRNCWHFSRICTVQVWMQDQSRKSTSRVDGSSITLTKLVTHCSTITLTKHQLILTFFPPPSYQQLTSISKHFLPQSALTTSLSKNVPTHSHSNCSPVTVTLWKSPDLHHHHFVTVSLFSNKIPSIRGVPEVSTPSLEDIYPCTSWMKRSVLLLTSHFLQQIMSYI